MPHIADFVAGRTPQQLYEDYFAPGIFETWADHLVTTVSPKGDCLDLACGTGVVSRRLARCSEVTSVTGIDVSSEMVEAARVVSEHAGVPMKIDFQAASALELPFGDQSFDYVCCQQGMQFFPDKVQGLKEARRVLKPKGTMAAAVWTSAQDGNPVFDRLERIVRERLGADLVPFGPFAFGDKHALRQVAEEAGLSVQTIERHEGTASFPDIRTFILLEMLFIGRPGEDGDMQPVFNASDPKEDETLEQLIDFLTKVCGEFVEDDGRFVFPITTHYLVGNA